MKKQNNRELHKAEELLQHESNDNVEREAQENRKGIPTSSVRCRQQQWYRSIAVLYRSIVSHSAEGGETDDSKIHQCT